jgi:predicted DNA-binding transcriptional regulator YafY
MVLLVGLALRVWTGKNRSRLEHGCGGSMKTPGKAGKAGGQGPVDGAGVHDPKVKRLIRLYDRLHSGQQVFLPKLAEEFGVTLRSIQRDMRALTEHSAFVERVRVEGKMAYQLAASAERLAVTFSIEDVVVTMLSLGMMGRFEGTGLEGYLGDVAGKVKDRLSKVASQRATAMDRKVFAHQPFQRNYLGSDEWVDEALSGLLYQKRLKLCYQGLGGVCKEHLVEPLTLLAYKSGLYLIGHSSRAPQGSRPAVFALERVTSCERTGEVFEYPEDWNPREFLPALGGLIPGEPTELELRFDGELKVYVQHIRWPEGTAMSEDEQGRLVLKTRATPNEELANWIIGFGPKVKVLAPAELREQVRAFFEASLEACKEE